MNRIKSFVVEATARALAWARAGEPVNRLPQRPLAFARDRRSGEVIAVVPANRTERRAVAKFEHRTWGIPYDQAFAAVTASFSAQSRKYR